MFAAIRFFANAAARQGCGMTHESGAESASGVGNKLRSSRFISLPLALRGNGVVLTVQLSGRL